MQKNAGGSLLFIRLCLACFVYMHKYFLGKSCCCPAIECFSYVKSYSVEAFFVCANARLKGRSGLFKYVSLQRAAKVLVIHQCQQRLWFALAEW